MIIKFKTSKHDYKRYLCGVVTNLAEQLRKKTSILHKRHNPVWICTKITAFILVFSCAFLTLNAQQDTIKKEFYISTSSNSLNLFGFQYKTAINPGTYLKISLLDIKLLYTNETPSEVDVYQVNDLDLSFDLNVGIEKRKKITGRLYLFYGLNVILSAELERHKVDNPHIPKADRITREEYYLPGIGFNSGILLKFNDQIGLATEFTPKLNYVYRIRRLRRTTGLEFDFDTESIKISFIYTWNKKEI
ncbi:MAG: hypothetical protein ACOCUV_01985 [bacterium]